MIENLLSNLKKPKKLENELPDDFIAEVYLELHPDVKAAGVDPAKHYLEFGIGEGRDYKKASSEILDYYFNSYPNDSESLFNKGMAIIGRKQKENSPIVVVGTARGGTSMVAGVLARLGVFMGDQAISPVYEDLRLSKAMEAANFYEVKEIANEYSEINCKWGWKRPSAVNYLDTIDSLLESPTYVFIFKDILSIAQRNSISMLDEILPSMERALSQYSQVCKFISDKNPYSLLVSYEKAVSNPLSFVSQLTSFYGLSPTETQTKEAISFIQINPLDYLETSRITKSIGRLGGINGGMVFGWARYIYSDNPASVDIFINDKKIGNLLANSYQSDLNEKYGLSCAYYYEMPESIVLKKGDLLRARVVNDVRDLENSPMEISN